IIGLAFGVVSIGYTLFLKSEQQFFQSYLQAFILVFGLAGGSLSLLMIHHVAGGRWGFITRGIMESGAKTIPLTIILFIPIYMGLDILYVEWLHPKGVLAEVIEGKSWYLNRTFFLVRTGIYFAVFTVLAFQLCSWSKRQSESGDITMNAPMRKLSGIGILIYILLITFASFDWTMSLEPAWFSSIWGPLFWVGQALITFCVMILVLNWLSRFEPLSKLILPRHFHDLGNYCFAAVILWTYMSFAQFTIIWHGNLPEELIWYGARSADSWKAIAVFLALFHFILPFFLLLSRFAKLQSSILVKTVTFLIFMRLVDTYWIVGPNFEPEGATPALLDLLLPIALGGIWFSFFCRNLKNTPLVAKYDPRFAEDLEAANHG
ncbi:MAG: hypothetical protein AAF492_09290, partial [Verrucomicrobiota bacterium]